MVSVVHICRDFSPRTRRELHSHQNQFTKLSLAEEIHVVYMIFSFFPRRLCGFDGSLVLSATSESNLECVTLTGACRDQSTRADSRKSINTQVSWRPASFLSSTDLAGRRVRSSAPSEVHRSWMMTSLFRARLSPSETTHYFGTRDKSSTHLRVPDSAVAVTAVLCLQPHVKREHTSRVRSEGVQ